MIEQMRHEFLQACRAIERRAEETGRQAMQDAWKAIMAENYAERDRITDRMRRIPELISQAKMEAGIRIGEKYGLDRDEMESAVKDLMERTH